MKGILNTFNLKIKLVCNWLWANKRNFAQLFIVIFNFSLVIYLIISLRMIWHVEAICPFPAPQGRFKHVFNAWVWWVENRMFCYIYHPKIATVWKFTVSWPLIFVFSYNVLFLYIYSYWYVFVHKSKIKYIFWFMLFWVITVLFFSFCIYIDSFISVYLPDRRLLWSTVPIVYMVIWLIVFNKYKKF